MRDCLTGRRKASFPTSELLLEKALSNIILLVGILVFVAHFLSQLFRKTNIPDVLMLMLLGILVGPALGLVSPSDFGKVGSVLSTIALVVILFESGT